MYPPRLSWVSLKCLDSGQRAFALDAPPTATSQSSFPVRSKDLVANRKVIQLIKVEIKDATSG